MTADFDGMVVCRHTHVMRMPDLKNAGYSMFEFIVLVVLASVMGVGLADRLSYYQELTEKTVMEATVRNMRSGLLMRRAELLIQENIPETAKLLKQNPVTWLESPPINYVGELSAERSQAVPPGSWYFDTTAWELVYLPNLRRHLEIKSMQATTIRYQVTALELPSNATSSGKQPPLGIALTLKTPFHWFKDR